MINIYYNGKKKWEWGKKRMKYKRNIVGYGRKKKEKRWKGGENIEVKFVVNYEEGGEWWIIDGEKD